MQKEKQRRKNLQPRRDNRVSGGRIPKAGTRKVANRIANILRLAAHALSREQGRMGELVRRSKGRLGGPKAITAMAHKLARILWHLLKYKEAYDPEVFARAEEKMKRKKLARLQTLAASLNYQLVPQP